MNWAQVARGLRVVGYDDYIDFENFSEVPMTSSTFVGDGLTQHATTSRAIDRRLDADLTSIEDRLAAKRA